MSVNFRRRSFGRCVPVSFASHTRARALSLFVRAPHAVFRRRCVRVSYASHTHVHAFSVSLLHMWCSEAKQAADLAAAAHEETLQHLRDKAEITAALKLKEFKTSLAAVATTQAARATEVRAIFDEMAARLSESSPPPYAGNNVASTAAEEDKPYEGGGAGAKASSDPRQPSDPTVVVVVVDSTPQSGGDPKPTPDTKKPPSEVVDTETQTKSSNGTTQDEAEASADADTSMSKAAAAAPESSQVDSESSAEKIPAPSTESAPEVEKTAM